MPRMFTHTRFKFRADRVAMGVARWTGLACGGTLAYRMSVECLGLGIVGCGVVSTRDLLPNAILPDVQARLGLVAVADVFGDRARAAAEQFGAPRWYADYAALVADPDVQVVAVTTPVPQHLPVALAAIEAGKHVYVQKTMTETVAEADRLIEAARAKGVGLAAAPGSHLWSKPLQEIREHVQSGRIGKVCWGRAARGTRHEDDARRRDDAAHNVDPTWYYKPGGGPLRDAAVYDLHTLTWMLGPVRRVTAMSGVSVPLRHWRDQPIQVEMDDNTHFVLDFGDERFVAVSSQYVKSSHVVPTLELYGPLGAIIMGGAGIDGSYALFGESEERDRHGLKERLVIRGEPAPPGSSLTGLRNYVVADIVELADSVLEQRRPRLSAEHSRHVIEIIEKVYASARSGHTLTLTTDLGA